MFKKAFILTCLAGLIVSASIAQTRGAKSSAPAPIKLTTTNDSLQYTIGAYLGQWLLNNGFGVTKPEIFKRGMDDVLLSRSLQVNPNGIANRLDAYQKNLISQRSNQQEMLLFENIKGKPGVGMLPSGVAYFVMKNGTGIRPASGDSILLHVKGFLPDGKLFEDTYAKNVPMRATPRTFVPGMNEVLQIMPVGSTWRIFIPSSLAYAQNGVTGLIPPYSAVIFEVELLQVAAGSR